MLNILNAVYGGLGQSIGSLVGGKLSAKFGIAKAFQYMASVDAAVLALFSIYHIFHHPAKKLVKSHLQKK